MIKFKEYINEESAMVEVYHGDNYDTTKIEIKNMMSKSSNNQEGIGIYFGSLDVAKDYGENIVKAKVNKKRFWGSRNILSKHARRNSVLSLFKKLHEIDNKPLWYMCTDWGIEVYNPEDVEHSHLRELADKMMSEEVRNFQITMAQNFGVEKFVPIWNDVFFDNLGTYSKENDFYCIISPKVKLTKYI